MDHLRTPEHPIVSSSFPSRTRELSHYPANINSPADEDWPEDNEDDWLLNEPHDSGHYGCSVPASSGVYGGGIGSNNSQSRKAKRRKGRRRSSENIVGTSITSLANRVSLKKDFDTSNRLEERTMSWLVCNFCELIMVAVVCVLYILLLQLTI